VVDSESSLVAPWPDFMVPVLHVLSDGEVRETRDLKTAVIDRMGLTEAQRAEVYDSGENRAANRAGWALSALKRAQAVNQVRHGMSQITEFGRQLLHEHPVNLTLADMEAIDAYRAYVPTPRSAPVVDDIEALPTYWFVGAVFSDDGEPDWDHSDDFRAQGLWRAQPPHKYAELILAMRPGDRIAIKAAFTRKHDLPFDIGGQTASVMAIRATGTITENPGDGNMVYVDWNDEDLLPDGHWYFWTSRNTVWKVQPDSASAQALIAFAFEGRDQDYQQFLDAPYWRKKYFSDDATPPSEPTQGGDTRVEETPDEPTYGVDDIVTDGCFIPRDELTKHLTALRRKKNLILQGPPGTGKTWLAKRLAYAMIGRKDRTLIHALQFHPTVSYEDFVRGWRPGADGRLHLADGVFLDVIDAARSEPDNNHVLVIEEINRANIAQVLGELLTLLEADKRNAAEALRLAYPRAGDERIFIPENLYLIGTMNLADRSLAIVDFALRRRFAFANLSPQFNQAWRRWVARRNGIDEEFLTAVARRVETLNTTIAQDRSLGEQYCIGHSFFTPSHSGPIQDPLRWIADVVAQEIGPLLAEYWFDDPVQVTREVRKLIG
jgi:5-methylcytosine-specific restriction protein B